MDTRLTEALSKVRYDSGLSQRVLAEQLGVSKKTVQHWEQGINQPPLEKILEWFRICGENPMHWMLEYACPQAFKVDPDSHEEIDEAFNQLGEVLTHEDKLALLYLYYGRHGSSPESILQLFLAHLHNPLKDRISIAIDVATHYRLNKGLDSLVGGEEPSPNLELLDEAILSAYDAIANNRSGYVVGQQKCNTSATPDEVNEGQIGSLEVFIQHKV